MTTEARHLFRLFWPDSDMLAWRTGDDGVFFTAVYTDDDESTRRAGINPDHLPVLEELVEADEDGFVEAFVDGHAGDQDPVPFRVDGFLNEALAATQGLRGVGWYSNTEPDVQLCGDCSDLFFWGCSDAEEITPDNIELLNTSRVDCASRGHESWTLGLFAARVRRMRPQGAFYEAIPEALVTLFDECGPPREAKFGNPRTREEGIARRSAAHGKED